MKAKFFLATTLTQFLTQTDSMTQENRFQSLTAVCFDFEG